MLANYSDEFSYLIGMDALQAWRRALDQRGVTDKAIGEFPFKEVLLVYQRYGKLGVDSRISDELEQIQQVIHQHATSSNSFQYRFLNLLCDLLLDQHNKSVSYNTYTGVPLFELIQSQLLENESEDLNGSLEVQYLLILAILSEMLSFEAQALQHMGLQTGSSKRIVLKLKQRILLSLLALDEFKKLTSQITVPDSLQLLIEAWKEEVKSPLTYSPLLVEHTLELGEVILQQTSAEVRLALKMSAIPISFSHDENIFIRMTQLFERFFNIIATSLQACIQAAAAYRFDEATAIIWKLKTIFKLSTSITNVFSTIPVDHFAYIRLITEKTNTSESKQLKKIIKLSTLSSNDNSNSGIALRDIFTQLLQDPTILGNSSFIQLVESMRMIDLTYMSWKKANQQMTTPLVGKLTKTYLEHPMFPFLTYPASVNA